MDNGEKYDQQPRPMSAKEMLQASAAVGLVILTTAASAALIIWAIKL